MVFLNKGQIKNYINALEEIGSGSQGTAYYDFKKKKVVKIYHNKIDKIKNNNYYDNCINPEIFKLNDYSNESYIFPEEQIKLRNNTIGYTMKYSKGKSLRELSPLDINLNYFIKSLDKLIEDTQYISNNHIETIDLSTNTLYNKEKNIIEVIDSDRFKISKNDSNYLYKKNTYQVNYAIEPFFIEGYLNDFVNQNKELKDNYIYVNCNAKEFLILLKKYLSEYIGTEIIYLNDAKKVFNESKYSSKYYRYR